MGTLCISLLGFTGQLEDKKPVETLVEGLVDPKRSEEERADLEQRLVREGVHAIPVLIKYRGDPRRSGGEPFVMGQCINAPPHQPLPKECLEPAQRIMTLGERCGDILYRILIPPDHVARALKEGAGKAGAEKPFVIRDWNAWWKKREKKTLDDLHGEARKLVDRFWRRGWEKGPLEWW